jgi:hypothetical protein
MRDATLCLDARTFVAVFIGVLLYRSCNNRMIERVNKRLRDTGTRRGDMAKHNNRLEFDPTYVSITLTSRCNGQSRLFRFSSSRTQVNILVGGIVGGPPSLDYSVLGAYLSRF